MVLMRSLGMPKEGGRVEPVNLEIVLSCLGMGLRPGRPPVPAPHLPLHAATPRPSP